MKTQKVIRVMSRGFIRGVLQFEERLDVADPNDIGALAEAHALRLLALPGGDKHMIELEFLDEPDPLQRFFRIGTDSEGMVQPIEVTLHAD